jgi:UDP-galactopyranose mutase
MTTDNKQLIDIVKQFTQMLHKNSYQTFQLVEKRILKMHCEVKDQREFFETLVSHLDRDVREMNA